MNKINPAAIGMVAFCTLIGLLLGNWVFGCVIGLGICLIATISRP